MSPCDTCKRHNGGTGRIRLGGFRVDEFIRFLLEHFAGKLEVAIEEQRAAVKSADALHHLAGVERKHKMLRLESLTVIKNGVDALAQEVAEPGSTEVPL